MLRLYFSSVRSKSDILPHEMSTMEGYFVCSVSELIKQGTHRSGEKAVYLCVTFRASRNPRY